MTFAPDRVTDETGRAGRLVATSPAGETAQTMTVVADGHRYTIPHERVHATTDGSYVLDGRFDDYACEASLSGQEHTAGESRHDEVRVPLAREHVDVERERKPVGKVRLTKRVEEHDVQVDEHVDTEHVDVERVPVERVLDEPAHVRQEGDTLVIPVMEERLVKQLVLVEEVRVTRRRHTEDVREPVTLRREYVDVEREPVEPDTPGSRQPPASGHRPEAG